MNLDSQKFSREYLEKISVSERKTLLLEMSIVLSQFISDENFDQNIKESMKN
jgi:hypothetical protein